MTWKLGLLTVVGSLVACAPETVEPGTQNFNEFDEWGTGIEDFAVAPTTETESGGTADDTYDGAYAGTFSMSLEYNGYICDFNNVVLQVLVTNGELSTPFTPMASTTCDLGDGANTYSPQVDFEGVVLGDSVMSGNLFEDYQFVFETAWSAMVTDVGNGDYQLYGTFDQEVITAFPAGTTRVSGSFILNAQ